MIQSCLPQVKRVQLFKKNFPIGQTSNSLTRTFYSTVIPFIRTENTVPVPLRSMSPDADFLISPTYKKIELSEDTFINDRAELIDQYVQLFTSLRADTGKYLADVSSDWDPIEQFSSGPRWPLPLLPLSKEATDEMKDLTSLVKTLMYSDKWGSKRQDRYQNVKNSYGVLTMPIKIPEDTDIFLPSNLQKSIAICEIVRNAAAAIEGVEAVLETNRTFQFKHYWMYCTVHVQLGIEPGEAMRDRLIHIDGMMGANKNTGEVPLWPKQHLIVANTLPTNYFTSNWMPPVTDVNKPDYSKNWFSRMDRHCKVLKKEKPKEILPDQMYLISPYLMHESPINNTGMTVDRFFMRIGFGNTHYNGPNYTVNRRLGKFRELEDRANENRPVL
jgi:hypothetical protein